jgi:hypothetical protein
MLALDVPRLDEGPQRAIETRPKAVSAWLERLPFASPVDTAQQLITALYALNRHPLAAGARLTLLALFQPVVQRAAASLEALLADSGVPPHAQQRKAGILLRELLVERSIGYKQVLLAQTGGTAGRVSPRRLAEVCALASVALRDVQSACHLTYRPLPDALWREIHALYRFARAANLADTAAGSAPPVSLAYRQALLMALADPPHMSPIELAHTRLYLDRFAVQAELVSAPVNGHRGFSIHTAGDAPPSPFAARRAGEALWLDTDALCRHLHATAIRLRTGDTPRSIGLPPEMEAEPSQKLCRHLLEVWSGNAQRASRRYANPGDTVEVVAGVAAIHRLLEQPSPAPEPGRADTDGRPIEVDAPAFVSAVVVHATPWTVGNDSAAGLALFGTPDAPLNLKVGDPLAVRADAAAAWSLAVIRWIRMRDAQQVELGLERLSPKIRPVRVRPLRGHRKGFPEPALLVPAVPALKQDERLLLPRHLYESGMDAELLQRPNPCMLTFGRRLEFTPSFDLIDFTVFHTHSHD